MRARHSIQIAKREDICICEPIHLEMPDSMHFTNMSNKMLDSVRCTETNTSARIACAPFVSGCRYLTGMKRIKKYYSLDKLNIMNRIIRKMYAPAIGMLCYNGKQTNDLYGYVPLQLRLKCFCASDAMPLGFSTFSILYFGESWHHATRSDCVHTQ